MWRIELVILLYVVILVSGINDLIVKTENGFVEGTTFRSLIKTKGYYDSNESVRAFLGIPFAAPPIDDLRWKPPVAPQSWNGTLSTKKYVPSHQIFLFLTVVSRLCSN